MTNFESPFGGWPTVKPVVNAKWGPGLHITGKYFAPFQRRDITNIWVISWIVALTFGAGILAIYKLLSEGVWLGMLATAFVGYFVFWWPFMYSALASQVDIKVFPEAVQVGNGVSYKNYDRNIPIEIRLEPHQKRFKKVAPIRDAAYQHASEVVMYYGVTRIMLAEFEVGDTEMAQALVLRLQAALHKPAATEAVPSKVVVTGRTEIDIDIR